MTLRGGEMDYTNPRLEWHMRFICPECGRESSTQQDWRRHLNDIHNYLRKTPTDFDFIEINDLYHQCQKCSKWVKNAHQTIALLQYHRFLHLPFSRTYSCRHCAAAFTRKRALCEHLYRHHSRLISRMERLQRAELAAETISLRNPKENPEFYMRFLCPQCGSHIERHQQWIHHLDTAHHNTSTDLRMHNIAGTNNHYCQQCKKMLYTSEKAVLQRHRFSHLPHRAFFQCAFCTIKKQFKSELLKHFIRVHPQNFADAKPYIKKPIEWGGTINERLDKELNMLLDPNGDHTNGKRPVNGKFKHHIVEEQTDIIQKALLDSLIDLETETMQASDYIPIPEQPLALKQEQQSSGSLTASVNNEYALDQSLIDLEAILHNDLNSTTISSDPITMIASNNSDDIQHDEQELDDLCEDMFEEMDSEPVVDTIVKHEHVDSEPEERIISIEINAVDETEQDAPVTYLSPQRKRRKLNNSARRIKHTRPTLKKFKKKEDITEQDLKDLLDRIVTYLCPECGAEHAEQNKWRQHVFNDHDDTETAIGKCFRLLEGDRSYICLDCMAVLHTVKQSELQRHRFSHMPYQSYLKCTACGHTKGSKPKMLSHLREYHSDMVLIEVGPDIDDLEEPDEPLPSRKRKKIIDPSTICQPQKEKSFSKRNSNGKFQCTNCEKEFVTETRFNKHCGICMKKPRSSGDIHTGSEMAENLKLIAHLRRARVRLRQFAELGTANISQ